MSGAHKIGDAGWGKKLDGDFEQASHTECGFEAGFSGGFIDDKAVGVVKECDVVIAE